MAVVKDYHLTDVVSDSSLESKVKFTNSALTPTVEILLYRVTSKVKLFSLAIVLCFYYLWFQNMCIDSVMLMLSAGDESASSSSGGKEAGGTSQEVLIPEVRETEISVATPPIPPFPLHSHALPPTATCLHSTIL